MGMLRACIVICIRIHSATTTCTFCVEKDHRAKIEHTIYLAPNPYPTPGASTSTSASPTFTSSDSYPPSGFSIISRMSGPAILQVGHQGAVQNVIRGMLLLVERAMRVWKSPWV